MHPTPVPVDWASLQASHPIAAHAIAAAPIAIIQGLIVPGYRGRGATHRMNWVGGGRAAGAPVGALAAATPGRWRFRFGGFGRSAWAPGPREGPRAHQRSHV